MQTASNTHASLVSTMVWLHERLALLGARGDVEASYAPTAEQADWLLGCPEALAKPLLLPKAIAKLYP
jgi:hypothetical protein